MIAYAAIGTARALTSACEVRGDDEELAASLRLAPVELDA